MNVGVGVDIDIAADDNAGSDSESDLQRPAVRDRDPEPKIGPGLDSTSPDLFSKPLFEKSLSNEQLAFITRLPETFTFDPLLSKTRFREK